MQNKEIGSYFTDIETQEKENSFFLNDFIYFMSGRACLDYVIKDIKEKYHTETALLPSWCCESMIEPFIKNDINVSFYPVLYNQNELQKSNNNKADILLNINYFGYDTNLLDFDGIVINDITHSLFSKVDMNRFDYTIASVRKWTGLSTGGIAYSRNGFKVTHSNQIKDNFHKLRKEFNVQKKNYLLGINDNKDYYNGLNKLEEEFDHSYDYLANEEDVESIKKLNIDEIISKRRNNASVLIKRLNKYCMFKELKDDVCPLFVPLIVDDRNELRNFLISNKVYCPVHWPISKLHQLTKEEKQIYDHEISIVCDQRYDSDDMNYICDLVEKFYKRKEC